MKSWTFAAVLIVLIGCCSARPSLLDTVSKFFDRKTPDNDIGTHWALLIAGSAGYGNYRHQADVAHAYQIVKKGGLLDEHIVVMMADDVAFNFENPHPGELYNRPGGPDVYKGLKPDYTGFKVNAKNFLAVLAGDESALEPSAAGGKVIKSGPDDKVFVYYADHGAPGILGMPWGPFLYADQLNVTLAHKAKGGFIEMVLFVEACESGSMFEGVLDSALPIYVTTAANAHESSWGTYCPGMSPSPPPEYTTCLGDLYSVAWMEEVDGANTETETLHQLYESVKRRTSNNFTYSMGSHVMEYGHKDIATEVLDGWVDELSPSGSLFSFLWPSTGTRSAGSAPHAGVDSRNIDLLYLWSKYNRTNDDKDLKVLEAEVSRRGDVDQAVRAAVTTLLRNSNGYEAVKMMFMSGTANGNAKDYSVPWIVELIVTETLNAVSNNNGEAETPVVNDWDCLRGMIGSWEKKCGPLDSYSMKYSRAFANLCNAGYNAASWEASLSAHCKGLATDKVAST